MATQSPGPTSPSSQPCHAVGRMSVSSTTCEFCERGHGVCGLNVCAAAAVNYLLRTHNRRAFAHACTIPQAHCRACCTLAQQNLTVTHTQGRHATAHTAHTQHTVLQPHLVVLHAAGHLEAVDVGCGGVACTSCRDAFGLIASYGCTHPHIHTSSPGWQLVSKTLLCTCAHALYMCT